MLSHHLFTLLPSPLFPSTGSQQDLTKEALNCLRVLGRVLVVVYEAEGEHADGESFAQRVLWKRQPTDRGEANVSGVGAGEEMAEARGESQFTIADDEDEEVEAEDGDGDVGDEGAQAFKTASGKPPVVTNGARPEVEPEAAIVDPLSRPTPERDGEDGEVEATERENSLPCLVDRLFSCTIDLLFCAGFTVPESVRGQDGLGDKINVGLARAAEGGADDVGSM